MRNIYLQVLDHLSDKSSPVLATVIRTKGSAPQKPGSSALFNETGLIAGTIGGGAVEGRIQEVAAERSLTGQSGFFHFNLINDTSRKEEAICGGQITILLDACPVNFDSVFEQIRKSLDENDPGAMLTMVSGSGEKGIHVRRFWMSRKYRPSLPESLLSRIEPVITDMIASSDPAIIIEMEIQENGEQASLFLEPVFPPPGLIIAGAGHIGRALSAICNMTGFEVTVIDDRPEYANPQNLPDATRIIVKDIGEAIKEIKKSSDTYMVIVTRGHKDDAEALRSCIGSDMAYIGMIGSRKKTEAMRRDFIKNGWATPEQWSSIHTPIGLEINSRTVEEIAVSIAAQLIMIKNSRKKKKSGCPA